MGRQIGIVQAVEDEAELFAALGKRWRLRAVPLWQSSPHFQSTEPGECAAETQLLFLAEDEDLILACAEGSEESYAINRVRARGLVIEWSRTRHREGSVRVDGRFYFDTAYHSSLSGRTIDAVLRAIRRLITTTYPMRSDERYPRYVGPHLWELARQGMVRVIYPNGSEVPLVPNG